MSRAAVHKGSCEHCRGGFSFELVHNGLQNSSYAYCSDCGMTSLLDTPDRVPIGVARHRRIAVDVEALLTPCPCGGRFEAAAQPRCPTCKGTLDAVRATDYIQAAIRRVAAGWTWQRNWGGLYCMIVDQRVVRNNWRPEAGAV